MISDFYNPFAQPNHTKSRWIKSRPRIKRPDMDMISSHPGCIFLAFLQSSTLSLLEDTPGGMSESKQIYWGDIGLLIYSHKIVLIVVV